MISPDTAILCDCGYNFVTGERPTRGPSGAPLAAAPLAAVPVAIKVHIGLQVLAVILTGYRFLSRPSRQYWQPTQAQLIAELAILVFWCLVVAFLYVGLLKKKNWARIALGVWTLPSGLILFLSRGARQFTDPYTAADVQPGGKVLNLSGQSKPRGPE
jgi:hypothetical protein